MRAVLRLIALVVTVGVASSVLPGMELVYSSTAWAGKSLAVLAVATTFWLIRGIVYGGINIEFQTSTPQLYTLLALAFVAANTLLVLLVGQLSDWLDYGLRINNLGTAITLATTITAVNNLANWPVDDEITYYTR
ncbi:hypothetical protein ACFWUP_26485 [Nocardia sp. NPDC058658]|uniref:hypothetical protein n=1 Tax=Nocardia sp. NPDC058658 TaxID=3346580 RepID=UPI0036566E8D